MTLHPTFTEAPRHIEPVKEMPGRLRLYALLLGVQTAGAVILIINGAPIYRQIARDFAAHRPHPGILWWAVAAVALIQIGYWSRRRLQLSPPQRGHVMIGHLVGFSARLIFVLASSSFALLFLIRFDQLSVPPRRVAMLLALLFSLFCYTLELERLARALNGTEAKL